MKRIVFAGISVGVGVVIACSSSSSDDQSASNAADSGSTGVDGSTPVQSDAPIASDALIDDAGAASCGDVLTDSNNCGYCGHSCRGATCTNGFCAPTFLQKMVRSPAVDATHLYWSSDTGIYRSAKSPDASAEQLFPSPYRVGDIKITADAVVFGDVNKYSFVPKAGGPIASITPTEYVDFMRTRPDTNAIYATQILHTGVFRYVPGGDAGGTHLPTVDDPTTLVYALKTFAIDGSDVIAAAHGYSGEGEALVRFPKDGSKPTLFAKGFNAVDQLEVVGSTIVGHVRGGAPKATCSLGGWKATFNAVGTDGSAMRTLATVDALVMGFAVDTSYVYYLDDCSLSVWRLPLAGGLPQVLYRSPKSPSYGQSIAIDGDSIYFTDGNSNLVSIPK